MYFDVQNSNYAEDALGNPLKATPNNCTGMSLSITVNGGNQISGMSYDAPGNMTADGNYTYTYDDEGTITTSSASVDYTYDGDGLRVEKSSGTYYWRSYTGQVLEETDTSGDMQRDYVFFGGRRIAWRDSSGNVYYYFGDMTGSTRVVTDSSGNICFNADYYPYGQENDYATTCTPEYKFAGMAYDSETGNYYDHARYYSPRLGRFMTPDPADMAAASPADGQSWNRYSYVENNPTNFIDPAGFQCIYGPNGTITGDDGTYPPCESTPTAYVNGGDTFDQVVFLLANGGSWGDNFGQVVANGVAPNGPSAPPTQQTPQSPQSPQSSQTTTPQKKPCTPLANNLQGTPAAGVDTLFDAFSRVTHPLDMLAVNATMFVAAGGQIVAGGLASGGGCLEPTPFEPLTRIAGGAAGTVSIASGTASGAFGVYFFKNYTLPAIKDWGCHE